MNKYRRLPVEDDGEYPPERPLREQGPVLFWEESTGKACVFCCPCGEREVYVTSPPHSKIEFDADGLLTIEASIARKRRTDDTPACHFWIKNGEVEMCADSTCSGRTLGQ